VTVARLPMNCKKIRSALFHKAVVPSYSAYDSNWPKVQILTGRNGPEVKSMTDCYWAWYFHFYKATTENRHCRPF
jgi:hypothetical protein